MQELHADLIRQERLRLRVAMLEAAERDATPTISVNASTDNTHLPNTNASTGIISGPTQRASGQLDPGVSHTDSQTRPGSAFSAQEAPVRDEPEAWVPQVSWRRSG